MSPDVISLKVMDGYRLLLCFDNGEERCFNVEPLLTRKCYQSLKNKALFATAAPLYGVVTWADGTDIDPDWLYEDSVALQSV